MLSFSIVTCTWNSEPHITQCMDSVGQQTYREFEQVFVDAGSDDGTLDRIQGANWPTQCVTGVRGGISNAMNVGIEMAQGDVIAHLHGDDYYLGADVLAKVAAEMDRTKAGWLFGRIAIDLAGKVSLPDWKMPEPTMPRLQRGNFIGHPAVFVRKDLFSKVGNFDTGLKYAMDYDLWLRLIKISKPAYLEDYLTVFRSHAGSASTANSMAAFREDHAVRRRHIYPGMTGRLFHEAVFFWRLLRRHAAQHG